MDLWCQRHRGLAFDAEVARWAASGQVCSQTLLEAWLVWRPTSHRPPPKSTGRDLFHAGLAGGPAARASRRQREDVMATLAELTAVSVVDALLSAGARTIATAGLWWRRAQCGT
jgi:anhydro-N-acetylmuramic acid kinase